MITRKQAPCSLIMVFVISFFFPLDHLINNPGSGSNLVSSSVPFKSKQKDVRMFSYRFFCSTYVDMLISVDGFWYVAFNLVLLQHILLCVF